MSKNFRVGNIPKELTFFIAPERTVYRRWDDMEDEGVVEYSMRPVFISDAANKKTLETGKAWVSRQTQVWCPKKKASIKLTGSQTISVPNDPIKQLTIVNLEIRGQGGRAYKIMFEAGGIKNLYADLREDVLLDIMNETGIKPGAIIKGDFVWAKVGSEMKIVRVGSLLHTKMQEATDLNSKSLAALVVGGLYLNKRGEPAIYLGEFWKRDFILKEAEHDKDFQSYNNTYYYGRKKAQIIVGLEKPYKVHVFHNSPWQLRYSDEQNKWWFEGGKPTARSLSMVKKHSYKIMEKIIDVPPSYVETFQNTYTKDKTYWAYEEPPQELTLQKTDPNEVHPILQFYIDAQKKFCPR